MKAEQILLAKRPQGVPTDDVFKYETVDLADPSDGEIQVEAIYISVDPYMRGRMNEGKSYVQPFEVNKPLNGHIVARVIKSKAQGFSNGDIVVGRLPWQTAVNIQPDDVTKVVSAASGAVGSVVGQIAKLKGARVVGIAGGKEKTDYLVTELGFDAAVDYKDSQYASLLADAVPDGVDVYFENVGGHVADEVLKHLNQFARIPVCGAISGYNDVEIDHGPRIQPILIKSQALMQGFIVANYADDFANASKELAQWVTEDKINSKTSIMDGFEHLPQAFRNLFTGDNFGKQVVRVKDLE